VLAAPPPQTYASSSVELEITPEPTPREREALLRGLERLLAGRAASLPPAYVSPWREAGIRESTGLDQRAVSSRRSSLA
jgi:hypothetical protein